VRIAIAIGALVVGTSAVALRGNVVHVRTYDHVVLARLRGA
jgi:ABC-type dipeptide/oligopeptide/nickel transport system permease subunit